MLHRIIILIAVLMGAAILVFDIARFQNKTVRRIMVIINLVLLAVGIILSFLKL